MLAMFREAKWVCLQQQLHSFWLKTDLSLVLVSLLLHFCSSCVAYKQALAAHSAGPTASSQVCAERGAVPEVRKASMVRLASWHGIAGCRCEDWRSDISNAACCRSLHEATASANRPDTWQPSWQQCCQLCETKLHAPERVTLGA